MHDLHRRLFLLPIDENYNYQRMPEVIAQSRYKGRIATDSDTGEKSWVLSSDFEGWVSGFDLGSSFVPFGGNNYLYGFDIRLAGMTMFRLLNDTSHERHKKFDLLQSLLALKVVREVGGVTPDLVMKYVVKTKDPTVLLYMASNQTVPFQWRVYYYNQYLIISAFRLEEPNARAQWLAPVLLLGQLYGLGWKRTLYVWALGVLLSEGVNYQMGGAYAGWSIISYLSYGQLIEQVVSERRGIPRNARELVIRGLAGYGTYSAVVTFYNDPAPFLQASTKTGTHHGIHHLSLVTGFLLNRWTR